MSWNITTLLNKNKILIAIYFQYKIIYIINFLTHAFYNEIK